MRHLCTWRRICAVIFTLSIFTAAGCGGEERTVVASDCPTGQTLCDDGCFTLASSPEACGACGNVCGTGELCSDGVCEVQCAPGLVACDGGCIDPQSSGQYCGASGDCTGGNSGSVCEEAEVCSGGSCQLTCTGGTVLCDGTCVDPMYDPDYCGASGTCSAGEAGRVCGDDEVCDQGTCRSECGAGLVICEGGCVDPMTNPRFCGAANACLANESGEVCDAGEACVDGACVPNCPSSQIACNGSCVDPLTNPNFCGASGTCTGDEAGRACGVDNACLGGSCFPTDIVFVSPTDAAETSFPRAVTFSFDTFIDDVTIHYTLDGSDPVSGTTTTTTAVPPFSIGNVGDTRAVRYIIEYDGEFSDIRGVANNINPPSSSLSNGTLVENVELAGSGPVLQVEPGETFRVSFDGLQWKSGPDGFCPGCIVQSVLSMDGVGLLDCRANTSRWPGQSYQTTLTATAPTQPGVYYLRYRTDLQFGCNTVSRTATVGYPIGAVEVRR